ncbi:sensor histidine kinase [Pedobacter sp. SD-b]|uniref:histidine kinase n=1 Tax=Pedobacter segetis TaxID=2793069 RepID=A0ABS1BPB7_9SPHI|nr:sensor histidine kinase [Pedobacter segetis]MBK0384251.1 sensor histidine kinase [Pedobacter segetis]
MNYKKIHVYVNNTVLKKMVLLFCLMLFVAVIKGQTNQNHLDSLEIVFDQEKSDTTKFNLAINLVDGYKNIDSAKASDYILRAEKLVKTKKQEVYYLSAKASFLIVYGKMETANSLLFKALEIAKSNKYLKEEAKVYNNLGVSHLQLSKNTLALKYQLEALKIREKLNNEVDLETSYINIGNVYFAILDDEKALQYYKKALYYANKLGLEIELGKLYNNIAGVFYDKNDYEHTKYYLLKSLRYKRKTNSKTGEVTTLNSLGDVCSSLGDFTESENYYQQALLLANRLGDDMNKANILNSLGHLHRYKNEFIEAVSYQDKALALSKKISYKDMEMDALLELSINYRNLKDYHKAYTFFKSYTEVKDSITQTSNKTEIAELQTKYDTDRREQKISRLNQENTIQKLTIKSKNLSITIMIISFLVALIIIGFLYYSYQLKQQKSLQSAIINQQDLASKAILKAEENERKRIASDLHDGLGQMFSTVKLNLSSFEDDVYFKDDNIKNNFLKTINLVDHSCKELRTISHQMASDVLIKLGLVAAIRDFIQNIDQNKLKVNFQSIGINDRIPSNIETVLYRVVQESVNNTIKHAKASNLDIQLLKEQGELTLIIEDNGIGFNVDDMGKFKGIGLQNIQSRVAYLKGNIDFDSAPNRGTVISIFVPLA